MSAPMRGASVAVGKGQALRLPLLLLRRSLAGCATLRRHAQIMPHCRKTVQPRPRVVPRAGRCWCTAQAQSAGMQVHGRRRQHRLHQPAAGEGPAQDLVPHEAEPRRSGGASSPAGSARSTPTPAGFPKVDPETQRSRDDMRRKVLGDELAAEEKLLADARASYANGAPDSLARRAIERGEVPGAHRAAAAGGAAARAQHRRAQEGARQHALSPARSRGRAPRHHRRCNAPRASMADRRELRGRGTKLAKCHQRVVAHAAMPGPSCHEAAPLSLVGCRQHVAALSRASTCSRRRC